MSTSKPGKPKKSKHPECCEIPEGHTHPSHSEFLPRLKRVQGQVAGIEKMIVDERYCVDILVQFRAAMAALRSVEVSIFEKHLKHCLSSALLSKDQKQIDVKIKELGELLSRRTSL
jgi:CsoR family transcriptional regulator, copper-sensing transcriptional repressor